MGASPIRRFRPRLVPPPDEQAEGEARPAPPGLDDSELLAAVREGDDSVAAVFHDRVRPQVDRTIQRLLGRSDMEGDDVAQIALMQIVTTLDRYRGDCSLDAWVAMITARVVYKTIRRRRLERRMFETTHEPDFSAMSGHTRPHRDAEARDLLAQALSHLRQMDPQRAWAFLLHDVWGFDLKEMAKIMSTSVSAAQSRLVRGRREIQARVAGDRELARALERLEVDR